MCIPIALFLFVFYASYVLFLCSAVEKPVDNSVDNYLISMFSFSF